MVESKCPLQGLLQRCTKEVWGYVKGPIFIVDMDETGIHLEQSFKKMTQENSLTA